MLKLYIKQKVFSIRNKFDIYDVNAEVKYKAEGEIFSLGKRLHVYDNNGNEVIFIKQKLMAFLPKYEISIHSGTPVEVVKNFTLFKHEYSVPALNIKIYGDFFAHEYMVEQNGCEIASLSKQWFTFGDAYTINIPDPLNELIALSAILVVDCCMESNNNAK